MEESEALSRREKRADRNAATLLGLGFLGLYVKTLCPTVYLGDSGEISRAIATGGIVHPPGYPLFSLLGRLALIVVPVGEPHFRIGCLVALAAALTVVVLFSLCRELGVSRPSALLAAAAFGVSYTFWSQSNRVEVYGFHVALASSALLCGLRYRRSGSLGWLLGAATAVSLGLAHHLTIVLLGPGMLILCGKRLWTDSRPWIRFASAAGILTVGPLFYLLLALWASAEPLQNWGSPTTPVFLWNHATAKVFQGYLEFPLNNLGRKAGTWLELFNDNFPYGLLLLPVLGCAFLIRGNRPVALGLLAVATLVTAYNFCYTIRDIAGYYLILWLIFWVFASAALDRLGSYAERAVRPSVAAAVAAGVLVVLPLTRNWAHCDLSGVYWARDLAVRKLESAEPNAVLITQGDNDGFPLGYVHDVLKVRPDVRLIARDFLSGMYMPEKEPSAWYLKRLRREGIPVLDVPKDPARLAYLRDDGALIELLEGPLRNRPVAITFLTEPKGHKVRHLPGWLSKNCATLPMGLIVKVQRKEVPVDLAKLTSENLRLWSRWQLPPAGAIRTDQEMEKDYIQQHYATMLENFAHLYELQGNSQGAATVYRLLKERYPKYPLSQEASSLIEASGNGNAPG